MSDEQRWPAAIAQTVANELVAALWTRCEQICIAGSLRRGKAKVGDVEILYVPRIGPVRKRGELFPQSRSRADGFIEQWLARSVLTKRLNVRGFTSWGPDNKYAVHAPSGVPVDVFATTANCWFISLVVRTGSTETTQRLIMNAGRRGLILQAYTGGIERISTCEQICEQIYPKSEQEVFELCGVPYLQPAER